MRLKLKNSTCITSLCTKKDHRQRTKRNQYFCPISGLQIISAVKSWHIKSARDKKLTRQFRLYCEGPAWSGWREGGGDGG